MSPARVRYGSRMELGVSIIGCGAVVEKYYARALRELKKRGLLRVVGLVDRNFERALQLQRLFPGACLYDDVEKWTKTTASNLTIVASPPASHAEHSILALRNGNHVLCEKPMAITPIQCGEMIKWALDSRLRLAIGMPRRFYPSLAHLKHLIDRGEFGDILSFSHREGRRYSWPVTTGSSFYRVEGGGGVLFDLGPHVLDVMIWLFGPLSIVSYVDDAMADGVEANCLIETQTITSAGSIQLSWDHDLTNTLHIIGTKAEGIVPLDAIDTLFVKKMGGCEKYEKVQPQIAFPSGTEEESKAMTPRNTSECVHLQIVSLIRCIQSGERIPVTGGEGREVISLIEECYKIANPIDMPWLPPDQNSKYKELHWRNQR